MKKAISIILQALAVLALFAGLYLFLLLGWSLGFTM